MSRPVTPQDVDIATVGALVRGLRTPVIVATHRNPDGDAIGSLLAMARLLRDRDLDVVIELDITHGLTPLTNPNPSTYCFSLHVSRATNDEKERADEERVFPRTRTR